MATFELTVTYVDAPKDIGSDDELIAKLGVKITNMPKETEHWDCKFTFGNHTESITYKFPDTKTISGNIWSAWLTNSTSGKLTVTVSYFKFKKLIKAESQSTVINLPSWLKPFIHYVGASPHAYVVNEGFGYLQGKTKASLEVSGYGAGGSKITSVSIKNTAIGWNQVYKIDTSESFPDKTFISPPLSRAGKNKFEIKVTDTRGRNASYTKEITVKSYAPPTIPTFTAERYNASGGKDSAGTYAKAYAEFWYTNVYDGTDDLNSVTAKLYYTDRNGQEAFIYIDSHTWSNLFGGGFTIDNSHTITLVVTDVVGGETRKDFEIMGTTYLLDFLPGGNGVGIGCEATTSGRLDVGFNTLFKNSNTFEKETTFNNNVKVKNAFLTGNKTDWNDGVAGAWIGNNGTMHLSGTNPNITFHYNNATSGYDGIAINSSGSANVFSNYTAGKLYVGNNSTSQTTIRGKFVQLISGSSGLAIRFNNKYGDTFTVPEPLSPKVGAKIMDLQDPTKKMSKSFDNYKGTILLLDSESDIRKKIMSAVTDSESKIYYDLENKPGISNLIVIYSCLSGISIEEVCERFKSYNYGNFKKEVADIVVDRIMDIQDKYNKIIDSDLVDKVLDEGRKKTMDIASSKILAVYSKMGLGRY